MTRELHTHHFRGITSYEQGHRHGYSGRTSANPDVPGHIHYMAGYTTFDNGHVHYFAISTGPEIEVSGGHYHYYRGITRYANGHIHRIWRYTSVFSG